MNKFVDGKFSNPINPKDGFAIFECKDARARKVLEFSVLIMYSEKLIQVTIMVGNTIFEALMGKKR